MANNRQTISKLATIIDYEIEENDDFEDTYAFVDDNGDPEPITGNTYEFKIAHADGSGVVDLSSSLTRDDADGLLTLNASKAQLEPFDVGVKHSWDLKRTDTGRHLFKGTFYIDPDNAV